MLIVEAHFFEAVHEPHRGAGKLEYARTSERMKVEYLASQAMITVTAMLRGSPDPAYPVTYVPITNVRSMRVARGELTDRTNESPTPQRKAS